MSLTLKNNLPEVHVSNIDLHRGGSLGIVLGIETTAETNKTPKIQESQVLNKLQF